MLGHCRLGNSGDAGQLARGEGLSAHESIERRRPSGISDKSGDFHEIGSSDHGVSRYDADASNKAL
jgi:hypothetical protein